MENDAEERLVKVFQDVFPHLEADKIRTATQSSVPGWESVAGIELMNEIEERFALVVDYDRAADLTSFALILAYIEERLSAEQSPAPPAALSTSRRPPGKRRSRRLEPLRHRPCYRR